MRQLKTYRVEETYIPTFEKLKAGGQIDWAVMRAYVDGDIATDDMMIDTGIKKTKRVQLDSVSVTHIYSLAEENKLAQEAIFNMIMAFHHHNQGSTL